MNLSLFSIAVVVGLPRSAREPSAHFTSINRRLFASFAAFNSLSKSAKLSTHTASYEQSVRQKSMTGYVPDGDELKKGYVYITPHEAVYHKDLSCTHLSLDISVDEDVEKYKNKRTQYKPCDKCTKHEKGDFSCVYIAKEGESYHTDLGCSGLKRTVKQVDLSTLKGMRPCMRCAKQGDT
jgi:hypothetical protein